VGCETAVPIEPTATAETAVFQSISVPSPPEAASVVNVGDIIPPTIASPCDPETCPYAGQQVTVIVSELGGETGPIVGPLYEIRDEFEKATGATLEIIEKPLDEHFAYLITDLTTGAGQFDASIAEPGGWATSSIKILPSPTMISTMNPSSHSGILKTCSRDHAHCLNMMAKNIWWPTITMGR